MRRRSPRRCSASFEGSADDRYREVMQSLVTHLHAFARDVRLTQAEWEAAIGFLTRTGHITRRPAAGVHPAQRRTGLSMLTIAINAPVSAGATESTVLRAVLRRRVADDRERRRPVVRWQGVPCHVSGQVRSTDGTPLAGAWLEVWQSDEDGFYDVQHPGDVTAARGRLSRRTTRAGSRSGACGPRRTRSRTTARWATCSRQPVAARCARRTSTSWSSAPGHRTLVTHIFAAGDEYLTTTPSSASRSPSSPTSPTTRPAPPPTAASCPARGPTSPSTSSSPGRPDSPADGVRPPGRQRVRPAVRVPHLVTRALPVTSAGPSRPRPAPCRRRGLAKLPRSSLGSLHARALDVDGDEPGPGGSVRRRRGGLLEGVRAQGAVLRDGPAAVRGAAAELRRARRPQAPPGAQPPEDRARDRAVQRARGGDGGARRGEHPGGQAVDPQGDGGRLHREGDERHHVHRRDRPAAVDRDDPDVPVRVRGVRDDGTVVVEGVIRLWVTPRPAR